MKDIDSIDTVKALAYQILIYSSMTSLITDGFKKAYKRIKGMQQEDKVSRFFTIICISVLGIGFGFVLKSSILTSWGMNIIFGFVIATTTFTVYESVISAVLKIIPKTIEKIFGK